MTLTTLEKAARALGRRLKLELVPVEKFADGGFTFFLVSRVSFPPTPVVSSLFLLSPVRIATTDAGASVSGKMRNEFVITARASGRPHMIGKMQIGCRLKH